MFRTAKWIALLVIALVPITQGSVASAALVAADSFNDYNVGPLAGANSGSGWAGGWHAGTGTTVVDPAVDLVAGGINGGNRAVQFAANNSNAAYRQLGSTVSGSNVFVSFLFRFDAGTISNNDFLGLWLDTQARMDSGTAGSHTDVPNLGLKALISGKPGDFFVRLSGTDGSYAGVRAALDSTVQIVGHLAYDSALNKTFYELWVNPNEADLDSPDAIFSQNGAFAPFDLVGFRTANLTGADRLTVDELRIATDWTDVVAVPEPGSLWLACGAGLGALALVRRRRVA